MTKAMTTPPKTESPALSLKGKTILVVDDEPGYREVIADEFLFVDATVITAGSSQEAFALAQAQSVDAVVSDVRMAGGSGLELLDQLKVINIRKPVVVLITGFSDFAPEDAFNRGVEAVFPKPCNLDRLVEAVYLAILPENERWLKPFEPLSGDFVITLVAASLEEAIRAHLLSFGRGGMFVQMNGDLPEVATRVRFSIGLTSAGDTAFAGLGICRWTRNGKAAELPSGCGIEFLNLTAESVQALAVLLNRQGPTAFIPKAWPVPT